MSTINDPFQNVSDAIRDTASIDSEHMAAENDRFIIHDSCGFEAAGCQNMEVTCDFMSPQIHMHDLKDRLHAIW